MFGLWLGLRVGIEGKGKDWSLGSSLGPVVCASAGTSGAIFKRNVPEVSVSVKVWVRVMLG